MTTETTAEAHIDALRSSAGRLSDIATGMSEAQLNAPAYPTEWSVAQVLSHLGSGAVIMQRRLEDTLAGRPTPDGYAPGVWDTWNAKTPVEQRDGALAADAALIARIEAVAPDERDGFAFAMGPMTLGFKEFVGMRLNEHALHTWDLDVAVDSAATIPPRAAELVVDNLELIARFTGKPTGDTATITVATVDPRRAFTVELTPDAVVFTPTTGPESADVELPAEAFARLVYGRLDPEHTPPGNHGDPLDVLRHVFPWAVGPRPPADTTRPSSRTVMTVRASGEATTSKSARRQAPAASRRERTGTRDGRRGRA